MQSLHHMTLLTKLPKERSSLPIKWENQEVNDGSILVKLVVAQRAIMLQIGAWIFLLGRLVEVLHMNNKANITVYWQSKSEHDFGFILSKHKSLCLFKWTVNPYYSYSVYQWQLLTRLIFMTDLTCIQTCWTNRSSVNNGIQLTPHCSSFMHITDHMHSVNVFVLCC